LGTRLDRQAGLADPTWANQGEQTAARVGEQAGYLGELFVPPDEKRRLDG
jgi:hypothetical protein